MNKIEPNDRPFIYYLRPRIYCPGIDAELVDLRIDVLGVHLKRDELATGRPYPNKHYKVGRRKIGRKAIDGILLSLSDWPPDFEMQSRWAIAAEYVATHKVTYKLLDRDYRAASDDMTLWYSWTPRHHRPTGTSGISFKFQDRCPAWAKDIPPVEAEPCMEVFPMCAGEKDKLDSKGRLVERIDVFALPTIESERVLDMECFRRGGRTPTLEMAIVL